MAKANSPTTGFEPNDSVFPADLEKIRLAFREPLNRGRSLKDNPATVLERLLDERVTIGGKKTTKRELIVEHLIKLAGSGDRAASKLLHQFLTQQSKLRLDEQVATFYVSKEVLQHVAGKPDGK